MGHLLLPVEARDPAWFFPLADSEPLVVYSDPRLFRMLPVLSRLFFQHKQCPLAPL